MSHKLSCLVSSRSSYEIVIRRGLLQDQNQLLGPLLAFDARLALITDDNVASLYGYRLQEQLSSAGLKTSLLVFPNGEASKSRQTKERLENQLLDQQYGQDSAILALGGGVVTDLAGYVASTYCRGVPLVMIPTSLVSMVDASIGGKTAVNTPLGKNLLGSIYQPQAVFIDPTVLHTLSSANIKNGIVEMIKHALIADATYFEYLDLHAEEILALNPIYLDPAIVTSCRIKKEIVEQDERKGKRHLLNFGHTIGHAIESIMDYSIPHGECVAHGLLVESHLAVQLGYLDPEFFFAIQNILSAYRIPLKVPPSLSLKAILDVMKLDKKAHRATPRFVMIERIGVPLSFDSHYCTAIEEKKVISSLEWWLTTFT